MDVGKKLKQELTQRHCLQSLPVLFQRFQQLLQPICSHREGLFPTLDNYSFSELLRCIINFDVWVNCWDVGLMMMMRMIVWMRAKIVGLICRAVRCRCVRVLQAFLFENGLEQMDIRKGNIKKVIYIYIYIFAWFSIL